MRVLIIHDEPVPLGGAESHVGTLARSLEQAGHTVEVCYEEVPQTIARFEPDIVHLQTIIVKVGIGALEYCQEIGIPHLISLHDYWPFCLPAGETIFNGLSPRAVETAQVPATIVGNGELTTILGTSAREYSGDMVTLQPMGLWPVRLTANHPVLAVRQHNVERFRRVNAWRRYNRKIGIAAIGDMPWAIDAGWIEAGDLAIGDYVCIKPLSDERDWVINLDDWAKSLGKGARRRYLPIEVDEDFAYFLGWYMAEGYGKVNPGLALGPHEVPQAQHLVEIMQARGLTASFRQGKLCTRVQVSSRPLARMLQAKFGSNAREKVIPPEVLSLPLSKLHMFVLGYLHGDGCVTAHGKRQRASIVTASRSAMQTLCLALLKLGIMPSVTVGRETHSVIRGKDVHSQPAFTVSVAGVQLDVLGIDSGTKVSKPRFERQGDMLLVPIRAWAASHYEGQVYNVETANHVFDLPFIVHNCRSRMMLKEKYRIPCVHCDESCEYPPAPSLRRVVGSSPSVSFNRRSQRIFQEHGFRYNTLVPHGIDTAYFAPAERHDGPTVTYMAAWARMPWKGLTEFSRAAMMVPLDTPGAVVKALGMCGNPVPRQRVRKHLQETDIFVFPSLYEETFGLSLAEAMSCGCACVAFDVAGANDLLSGIGILVATGDVAGLTSALTHLLNHPEQCEQLGATSRERMVRYFDMAAMAADYTRLYGGLVDNWRNWREWLPSYKCREIPFNH